MLHVLTEVRPSAIPGAGLGLFALETIRKGSLISRWQAGYDQALTLAAVEALPEPARGFVDRFGWRDVATGLWRISLDDSRYINHGRRNVNIVQGVDGMRAGRDIHPGEELLEDYSSYDPDFQQIQDQLLD